MFLLICVVVWEKILLLSYYLGSIVIFLFVAMLQPTPDQARQLVDKIREENGGITLADRKNASEGVLRALENVRDKLGRSIRTTVHDRHTSDLRFVFELIRSAEHSSYAHAANGIPTIKFTIQAGKIIIENNDDGFTEEDLKSICDINQGLVEGKGVWFRSVFQVAYRADIRSGSFNFCFEYRPGDSAMGMVTPMNIDDSSAPYHGTQITLFLNEPHDFRHRLEDLNSVLDTFTLFLTKLQRIDVITNNDKHPSKVVYARLFDENKSTTRLIKKVGNVVTEKWFYMQRETFSDLLSLDARQNSKKADVVLAFPITKDSKPIFEPQEVFSFLPIGGFGFKVNSSYYS